jgi:hypothetical protein
VNKFNIIPADDFIWNKIELLEFLIKNQYKDILIDTNQEGCCARAIGLYDLLDLFTFNSVSIRTSNILEKHDRYHIIENNFFKFCNVNNTNYTQYHEWNSNNIFGAFYNRAIWHRIGLAAELSKHDALLNFRSDPHNEDSRRLFELQKLFEFAPDSATRFLNIQPMFPRTLEEHDGYTVGATTMQHTDQLCGFYPNLLVDVVAETFTSGNTFFVTEKTIRPILLKKPFIIMGSKNFMIYLRQMGFRTFYEYWDEDYDGFFGKEKYLKILEVINGISQKSKKEWNELYNSMQPILDHNYNLLINQTYNRNISYVN